MYVARISIRMKVGWRFKELKEIRHSTRDGLICKLREDLSLSSDDFARLRSTNTILVKSTGKLIVIRKLA